MNINEFEGDFVICSKNYISVYSINGNLLTITSMKDQNHPKISSCIITSNNGSYEDNYVITGH